MKSWGQGKVMALSDVFVGGIWPGVVLWWLTLMTVNLKPGKRNFNWDHFMDMSAWHLIDYRMTWECPAHRVLGAIRKEAKCGPGCKPVGNIPPQSLLQSLHPGSVESLFWLPSLVDCNLWAEINSFVYKIFFFDQCIIKAIAIELKQENTKTTVVPNLSC